MAVSSKDRPRRRRYTRQPATGPFTVTPQQAALLRYLGAWGFATTPQLAALACPSPKSARRSLRHLLDRGWIEVIPIPRIALVDPARQGDPSLLYGSAPNLYMLTRAGFRILEELGEAEGLTKRGEARPRSNLFLAHELLIRDVRVWLELAARRYSHQLASWCDGAEAVINLRTSQTPKVVRPDAWFVYRFQERALVGLLEVDRGTERGTERWRAKLQAYHRLYQSGRLQEVTGYQHARILVITPDARRRTRLAELIEQQTRERRAPELAARFWLAERSILNCPDLTSVAWEQPQSRALQPLLPPELVGAEAISKGEPDE